MPSWQARMLSVFSRLIVKRAVIKQAHDVEATVRMVRNWLGPSRLWPPRVPLEVTHQPVENGTVRGEWLRWAGQPPEKSDCCTYYLHGGGYFAGSPRTHRNLTAALTGATRMPTFALDYRLAPEHQFPAAVEDAVAGYRWLLEQGFRPEQMVIGGDSAGGGLTMATVLWLRDAGLPLPAGVFLLSPWTDLACTGNSLDQNDPHDHLLCGKEVLRFSKVYHGEASPHDPLVSPLYGEFNALPPLRIYASDTEILLDDAVRLAERARCYGVKVDLRIWNDLIHAWPVMINFRLPESRQVVEELAQFIEERVTAPRSIAMVNG
ncbi:MAG: alpha/beta hydrolase [Acidobacteriota bacterium]